METQPRAELPEDEERRHRTGAQTGEPIETEFPPSERQLLDDDFTQMYGRDPDEQG